MRDVVLALAQDFDVIDVAAAAVKMTHDADTASALATTHVPAAHEPENRARDKRSQKVTGPRGAARAATGASDEPTWTPLWIGAGRRAGLKPGDLVGAIAGEAGIEASAIGAIRIFDGYSLVQVDEAVSSRVVASLKNAKIRGQKVRVRRDNDAGSHRTPPS
jgi:ATP-dependent RNA helicase DeaD